MKFLPLAAIAAALTSPALAQDHRDLDAHEHGVGQLDIAVEGGRILMELHAPGADIVGFEHAAESAEDRAALEDAVAVLARPLDLFALPDAAGCAVTVASAALIGEDDHVERSEQEEHTEHDHHEGHAGHDDHEDHEEHEHGHTEFLARYTLDCDDTAAVTQIGFPYFETFPTALELEVQMITDTGARAFEVERDSPVLDLDGAS